MIFYFRLAATRRVSERSVSSKSFTTKVFTMSVDSPAPKSPTALIWIGRVISLLPILGLTFSAVMKFMQPQGMAEEFARLGWPMTLAIALGIIEIVCTIFYAIPQTAVLGAILLTGYLGGATATHVRIDDAWFGPVIMGAMIWLGLLFRDRRLWPLLPFRKL
jgi:hypothetical protein